MEYVFALQDYRNSVRAARERNCHEFTRPYLGGDVVPAQLEAYIISCAQKYADTPNRFTCPWFAVVQSSGFGKSRLLRELANRTKDDDTPERLKVLYTCMKPGEVGSSGYPLVTPSVREHFFPDTECKPDDERVLVDKLCGLYDYALTQWQSVGGEWFALFDDQADFAIRERLENHKPTAQGAQGVGEQSRTVVLAVDGAGYLLRTDYFDPTGWYKRLRSALVKASHRIRDAFGPKAAIFAVLVDSNPAIVDRESCNNGSALSQGLQLTESKKIFSPFVLTHTMDIRFEVLKQQAQRDGVSSKAFYQELVARDYKDAWPVLVAMGRPLWDRVRIGEWHTPESPSSVIDHAAYKLIGGWNSTLTASFERESMFSAASVLCRLGLNANSWAPLACQLVSKFMATLVQVTTAHNQWVTTYSSEPVLTFGAARLWYGSANLDQSHDKLAKLILPEFRKLLSLRAIDAHGSDGSDLIGRMIMLLTVDATKASQSLSRLEALADYHRYEYAGEFFSVEAFLHVLYGEYMTVIRSVEGTDVTGTWAASLNHTLRGWQGWQIGFSHFVCVTHEPSEDELWALLARRAAGVFPRELLGDVDLLIPIFQGTTVSVMLVRVDSRTCNDSLRAAASSTRPSAAFGNELTQRGPADVVRVYLNLSGTERKPFYLVDTMSDTRESFVLCVEGLAGWHTRSVEPERFPHVPVMSDGVASELRELLGPWLAPERLVNEDFRHHGRRVDVTIRSNASHATPDELLRGDLRDTSDDATSTPTTAPKKRKKGKKKTKRNLNRGT